MHLRLVSRFPLVEGGSRARSGGGRAIRARGGSPVRDTGDRTGDDGFLDWGSKDSSGSFPALPVPRLFFRNHRLPGLLGIRAGRSRRGGEWAPVAVVGEASRRRRYNLLAHWKSAAPGQRSRRRSRISARSDSFRRGPRPKAHPSREANPGSIPPRNFPIPYGSLELETIPSQNLPAPGTDLHRAPSREDPPSLDTNPR